MLRLLPTLALSSMLLFGALPSTAQSATLQATLKITVVLHPSTAKVTIACGMTDPKDPKKLLRVLGCWNPTTMTVHAIRPKSFCDTDNLNTLGHEIVHAIGWDHGPDYRTAYFPPESTYGCVSGDFVVPRP